MRQVWLMARRVILLGALLLVPAAAHEVRPGYIEINETERDRFEVIWKQPVRSAGVGAVAGLGLRPVFPENCRRMGDSVMRRQPGALLEKFSLHCDGGLFGQSIGVEGLQRTITDVLVQMALLDGGRHSLRLTANAPVFIDTASGQAVWDVTGAASTAYMPVPDKRWVRVDNVDTTVSIIRHA